MSDKVSNTLIVLTVANELQKGLCERFLSAFPPAPVAIVCDNRTGSPIGSGGAVLQIIETYFGQFKKIIIVNSGGSSKRAVNYAVRGKAFTRLIYHGTEKTLLECILDQAMKLMRHTESGVLVCCGDILLDLPDAVVSLRNNTGFCIRTDFEIAANHGVMIPNKRGTMERYVHKQPIDTLQSLHPLAKKALTDTGMVFFNQSTVHALKSFCMRTRIVSFLQESKEQLCLYADMLSMFCMPKNENIIKSFRSENSVFGDLKSKLYQALLPYSMNVNELKHVDFLHFGTSSSVLELVSELADDKSIYHAFHCFISETSTIGRHSLCDNSLLSGCCQVGNNSIVTDIILSDVVIPDDTAVCGIRLFNGKYIAVVVSVYENPKETYGDKTLWESPRFYPADSFTESYQKYAAAKGEEKLSLSDCLKNADYDYWQTLWQYISDLTRKYHSNAKYKELRQDLISRHFKGLEQPSQLICAQERVEIHLPIRINLSGTWTDAMPICMEEGGEIINMAISFDGNLPIEVILEKTRSPGIELCSDGKTSVYADKTVDDLDAFILHNAALKTWGITPEKLQSGGLRLQTNVYGIDKGSGLGVSSILLAGCFLALRKMFRLPYSDDDIIYHIFVAEQIMGTGGGWQDQVGVLYPGIKISSSAPGLIQKIHLVRLQPGRRLKQAISEQCLLVPTGIRHFGRFIVADIADRYLQGNIETRKTISELKQLNDEMLKSILTDNLSVFSYCVNKHHALVKQLSPYVMTAEIDSMVDQLMEYASAVSICGAGGGGYLFVQLKESCKYDSFLSFFKERFPSIKSNILKIRLFESTIEM